MNIQRLSRTYFLITYSLLFVCATFWEIVTPFEFLFPKINLFSLHYTFKPIFVPLALMMGGWTASPLARSITWGVLQSHRWPLLFLFISFSLIMYSEWIQPNSNLLRLSNFILFLFVIVMALTAYRHLHHMGLSTLSFVSSMILLGCIVYLIGLGYPNKVNIFRLLCSIMSLLMFYRLLKSFRTGRRWSLTDHTRSVFFLLLLIGLVTAMLLTNGRAAIASSLLIACFILIFFVIRTFRFCARRSQWLITLYLVCFALSIISIGTDLESRGNINIKRYYHEILADPVSITTGEYYIKDEALEKNTLRARLVRYIDMDRYLNYRYVFLFWREYFPWGQGIEYSFDFTRLRTNVPFRGAHSSYIYQIAAGGYFSLFFFLIAHAKILPRTREISIYQWVYFAILIQGLIDNQHHNFLTWVIFALAMIPATKDDDPSYGQIIKP